jgi:tetratricopeptide (TPR) repeat protein
MLNHDRTLNHSQSFPAAILRNGAELEIQLKEPRIFDQNGKRRVKATAVLIFHPIDPRAHRIESQSFPFIAPLSPITPDSLHWYLEQYNSWPHGAFREQAVQIETKLPAWGQTLYQAITASPTTKKPLSAWLHLPANKARYFSISISDELPTASVGAAEFNSETQNGVTEAPGMEAAGILLSLPWELLFDGKNFIFQGKNPVIVRRRLLSCHPLKISQFNLPIRILLVSPRPEDEHTPYLDHRSSALPLLKVVASLGDPVELTILNPPSYAELEAALQKAEQAGQQYTVIHFDGLCRCDGNGDVGGVETLRFEAANDLHKIEDRIPQSVTIGKFAATLRNYRIPLVCLNIRTSVQAEFDPTATIAARLLEGGITSVVGFPYGLMEKSLQRFNSAFYEELTCGSSLGKAVLFGRKALYSDDIRNKIIKPGELKIFDWFVPVLYQAMEDLPLISGSSMAKDQQEPARKPIQNLSYLPEPPSHRFWGRSRELLALERLFQDQPYTVIRGIGGSGKTTLAVELARWLSETGRFTRIAFVNLTRYGEVQGILDCLGKQLLPEGEQWSVTLYNDITKASQPVERILHNHPTLIIFDNIESILPKTNQPVSPEIQGIFELFQALSGADSKTRLLFTSRERLPAPYHEPEREIMLGNLKQNDAIKLMNAVLAEQGFVPNSADPGDNPRELGDLVTAVRCHARALVLLAPEIHRWGVRATIANLQEIMTGLSRKHPGEIENYLFASIELLLRRLPQEMREKIFRLGVFQDGADIFLLAHVMGMNPETSEQFVRSLIEAGLAEKIGYEYYRFDPALVRYLFEQMSEPEREEARALWAEIIEGLVKILYQQIFDNADIAFHLALIELELPNILSWLDWINDKKPPEEIIDIADNVGSIFSSLGYQQILMKANRILEAAEQELGNQWSHSRYLVASNRIDRHLKQGELQIAYEAAHQLLQSCLSAGPEAYKDADYDIAIAYAIYGKVQRNTGSAGNALEPLAEARRRFQILAANGNVNAEEMYSTTITEIGNCLRDLGRLDKAAANYEESINLDQRSGNQRGLAVTQIQLGTIRFYQKRYREALDIFSQALDTFTELNEPGTVAVVWHQIGMVHRETGNYDKAEEAYRQSLSIESQHKNVSGEAGTLNELGNLYDAMGRMEEASSYYRQARDIYIKLQDKYNEAHIRSNLADSLINLEQYDEARREILRAIDCLKPFGHSAEPWKAWIILYHLELRTGNSQAANESRERARHSYLEYRRDGGESQCPSGECCALVEQAIDTGNIEEAEQALEQFMGTNDESWVKILLPKLLLILKGEWTATIIEDPQLDYDDAAELQLLLEKLGNLDSDHNLGIKKLK